MKKMFLVCHNNLGITVSHNFPQNSVQVSRSQLILQVEVEGMREEGSPEIYKKNTSTY